MVIHSNCIVKYVLQHMVILALLPFEITSNVPIDLTQWGRYCCLEAESNNLLWTSFEQITNIKRKLFPSKQQASRRAGYPDPNLIFLPFIIVIFWLMIWLMWWDWYVSPHILPGCGRNVDSFLTSRDGEQLQTRQEKLLLSTFFRKFIFLIATKCYYYTIQLKMKITDLQNMPILHVMCELLLGS